MIIYLQSPDKTKIEIFDNQENITPEFLNWNILSEEEINAYLIREAKELKIRKKILILAFIKNNLRK